MSSLSLTVGFNTTLASPPWLGGGGGCMEERQRHLATITPKLYVNEMQGQKREATCMLNQLHGWESGELK